MSNWKAKEKMRRTILYAVLFTLLFSALIPQFPSVNATPSWLGTWRYRIPLTIDSGDVDADLANFTVLIHLSSSSGITGVNVSAIFAVLGSSSLKIAITTSDGTTQCFIEVESWNSTAKVAYLWTRIVSIANASDTGLYFYYDSTQPDNTGYVGLPNSAPAEAVWNAGYVFVSHMLDDPDTGHIRDSTSYDNDGTKKGINEPIVTTSGKIGDAQSYDGNDYLTVADHASLRFDTGDFTISLWMKITSVAAIREVVGKWQTGTWNRYEILARADHACALWISNGADFNAIGTSVIDDDAWHHIVGVADRDTNLKIYVDGICETTTVANSAGNIGNNAVLEMGKDSEGFWNYITGLLDEVRFSNIARPVAWVKADYESSRDHFLTFGGVDTNYVYLTVYFQSGITLYVNSTAKTNATQTEFFKGTGANLTSTLSSSYTFFKYAYNSTSTLNNPLALTLNGNTTVWAYSIISGGVDSLSFILAIVGIAIAIVALIGFTKR